MPIEVTKNPPKELLDKLSCRSWPIWGNARALHSGRLPMLRMVGI